MVPPRVKSTMKKLGLSGVNKPKKTPNHSTKAMVVMAHANDKYKLVRFGQQGASPAGANPQSEEMKAKRKAYYARHNAQDPNPSKLSARYWSNKTRW